MAIGRFGGTWALSRIERVRALRWSGVAVSTSLVLLVASDAIPVSLVAMAGWGLGVAIVFPAAMSAAAEHATRPAHGIGPTRNPPYPIVDTTAQPVGAAPSW